MTGRVLIVDDERLIRTSLQKALAADRVDSDVAASADEAIDVFREGRHELVILDLKLAEANGLDVLRLMKKEAPDTKIVVITAHGNVDVAVEAMKLGAYDFVTKPFELEKLLATTRNALTAGALERRLAYHDIRERREIDHAARVTHAAPTMVALERESEIVAKQPVPVVLITGETGSGKALVARKIHFASNRASGPFVELNAAAIPETLVESELFGHERGAFSDARDFKPGLVEIAHEGTLFLDEVGDLGPSPQAKLLMFLESFTFRRVGGTVLRSVDVRVVAATNRNLEDEVKAGKFRADLYYRLNALTLKVPPLRERREDIRILAEHFLLIDAQRFQKKFRRVSDEAATLLSSWRWPGNVRELKAVVQRAVLMNDGEYLLPNHLPPEIVEGALDPIPAALNVPFNGIPTLEQIELRYIRAVYALSGANKVRAAEKLGITRQTLSKRLGEAD
jgi:two-component system, NtrC family, response regulator AtoC